MTLVERMAQWPEQWRREGVAEGRREGVAEGRREGVAEGRREGVAEGRREGVAEGRREGVAEGRREGVAEGRREGVAEGRREGRREGVAGQRALLGRVAVTRFGEAVGERVEGLLHDNEDWATLSAAAELIATARGEAELIDGLAEIVRRTG